MAYLVQVKHLEPRVIAVVRRRAGPAELHKVVPEGCGVVWSVLRALDVQGTGRNVAVYWDDHINLEVGVGVESPFTGHGEVLASRAPAGMVATTAHFGPYDRLGEAHTAIRDYCLQNGLPLAGPNWEIYGHWQADPTQLRTDVCYLLQ
jgi:effector-binding domain-containing protein